MSCMLMDQLLKWEKTRNLRRKVTESGYNGQKPLGSRSRDVENNQKELANRIYVIMESNKGIRLSSKEI